MLFKLQALLHEEDLTSSGKLHIARRHNDTFWLEAVMVETGKSFEYKNNDHKNVQLKKMSSSTKVVFY